MKTRASSRQGIVVRAHTQEEDLEEEKTEQSQGNIEGS